MTPKVASDLVGWVERSDTHQLADSHTHVVGWVERSDTHHALRSATFNTPQVPK